MLTAVSRGAISVPKPTITKPTVARAVAVICPATDGGYVLIGLARPLPALFREVPWGGSEVLQATLERARETNIALELMAPWYDVDRPEDLERLRADLRDAEGPARAPETARALSRLLL